MSSEQFSGRAARPPSGPRRPPVVRGRSGRVDPAPAGHGPGADDLLWVAARPIDVRGRVVVEVVGEVDHYTAPLLGSCLRGQTARRGLRELVVDVRRVTFLAGVGLALLVEARERCAARGVRLALRCDGRRAVLGSLELAGLSALLGVEAPEQNRDSARPVHPQGRRGPRRPPRRWQPVG